MYYIYILRCKNGELYTGIASEPKRRIKEHLSAGKKAAKYTKSHPPVKLESLLETESKNEASKLEYRIKKLPKVKKEELLQCKELSKVFGTDELSDSCSFCAEETVKQLNKLFGE